MDTMDNISAGTALALVKTFEGKRLTTICHKGKPWWITREVGAALEYADSGGRLVDLVMKEWADEFDDDDRWLVQGDDLRAIKAIMNEQFGRGTNRVPSLLLLSESGIYKAAILSRKPEGRRLRNWLAKEVLPEIRQTGQFGGAPAPLVQLDQKLYDEVSAARADLQRTHNRVLALLAEVRELRHEVSRRDGGDPLSTWAESEAQRMFSAWEERARERHRIAVERHERFEAERRRVRQSPARFEEIATLGPGPELLTSGEGFRRHGGYPDVYAWRSAMLKAGHSPQKFDQKSLWKRADCQALRVRDLRAPEALPAPRPLLV